MDTADVRFGGVCGGRSLGKNFLSCCGISRVRSSVWPVCVAEKPLAVMLCVDDVRRQLENGHAL